MVVNLALAGPGQAPIGPDSCLPSEGSRGNPTRGGILRREGAARATPFSHEPDRCMVQRELLNMLGTYHKGLPIKV